MKFLVLQPYSLPFLVIGFYYAQYSEESCRRNVSQVHEAWFANEEKVRKKVGLLEQPVVPLLNSREVSYLNISDIIYGILARYVCFLLISHLLINFYLY